MQNNCISKKGLCKTASDVFLWLLFLLLPLCVHDTFHNATETKTAVFYTLAALYLLGMLCIQGFGKGESGRRLHKTDLFFVAFVVIGILASVLSGFGMDSLGGKDNRRQGIVMFSLYLMLFFLLKQHSSFSRQVKRSAFFTFGVVCLLGILNQFKLDSAGYISALIEPDRVRFTSTIGNIGFYSAYCILLFPTAYAFFLHSSTLREAVPYGVLSLIGVFGAMASHTESAFLGLCAAFAILPLCVRDYGVKRYFLTMPLLLLSMKLYALAVSFFEGIPLSALTGTFLSGTPFAVLMCTYLLCALLFRNLTDSGGAKFKRIYGIMLAAVLVLSVSVILFINLYPLKSLPPIIAKYLLITPEWGTDRGYIWFGMTELWKDFSPLEKLIGGGFGCVVRWDRGYRLFSDAVIDAAHNEYLHYLLTHGILGLSCYLAFIASSVVRCIKSGSIAGRCLCAGCIAYAVQATVNIAQMFSTPLFFVFLFLLPLPHDEESLPEKKSCVLLSYASMILLAAACFGVGMCCTVPA